ncbi:hypothetical protein AMAG_17990 [Allomyces macrogynus ATCC 38327]|uniref:Uncharacterized protein n=1 Tax=Allomyces macrogynus (strain ATCC 38327) TaxID=578462 RepID=A0A0L0S3M8_ALLM3|nr:hypothetical protein AMAG_17990 [Allomyces macrogynus ATCC 38327]|eukprot:KNE56995.1 hypothetical protein AMAG_17990 [Allomyces macrogynus ATCC 38327]
MGPPGALIVPASSLAAAAARVAPRLLVVLLLVPPSLRKIAGGGGSPLALVVWVLASMLLEGACSLAALDVQGGVASGLYFVLWAALYGQWIAWAHDWSLATSVSAETVSEVVTDHLDASRPRSSSLGADVTDSSEAAVPYSSLRNRYQRKYGRRRTLRPSDRDALLNQRDENSSSSDASTDNKSGLTTATAFHSFTSIDWTPRTLPIDDTVTRSFAGSRIVCADEAGVAAPIPASIPLTTSSASLFATEALPRSAHASPPDGSISEPLSPSRWLLRRQVDVDEGVARQQAEVDPLDLSSGDGQIEG